MRLREITYKQLSAFFVPLGVAASLTSFTHVIINGTMSRGENAAFIIACYAVAMAVFGIAERPMLVFRQASSTLVKDRESFKLLSIFFLYVLLTIMLICFALGYTPIGHWVYITFFNATSDMVGEINVAFRVITFVIIFSGIRGIYQGVVIQRLATNWVTIGVVVRLFGMFAASYLFIALGWIKSATGALIFVIGMFIEAGISFYKGNQILRHEFSDRKPNTPPLKKREITRFYFPLAYYFVLQSILTPVIYVLLAKAHNIEMSIASFSLAFSITQLMLSFFMYTHQLVLQFYKDHKWKIIKFMFMISIIPTLLLCILCYTPVGPIFMMKVMGADEALSMATLAVLKFFIIKTLVFPWTDFLNGILMLARQTNRMLFAQVGNLVIVVISLWILIRISPELNGVNGSIAASIGELTSFFIICFIVYQMSDHYKRRRRERYKLRKRS